MTVADPTPTPKPSLHQRLTDIVNEATGVNLENDFNGSPYYLEKEQRAHIRKVAARLVVLMDEYDRLDPLE